MPNDPEPSPLSSDEREASFPVHVELGKEVDDYSSPVANPEKADKKSKSKKKTVYPILYLDAADPSKFPKSGCALIEFKRVGAHSTERDGQEPTSSVELEIHTICLPSAGQSDDNEGDISDGMKKTAKDMGLDVGENAAEEKSETPDDETGEEKDE